ncbi:uncharacterized protein LY89DRAFT_687098 [Mollisia scopiformis]|uniref:Zn(2)-C6 fungal-type domain-containing protein n=1 Tax=Mollisia scopiformis TaxID=149040 RepID=A0A194X159_MOLSC|nr:uncharacterized protein LY89DRAFT_687098 [Mollisia scopiformis]KUJ13709.1 hypothetical protein LY89DRAFT_687098 [Mollisia scopiformis]
MADRSTQARSGGRKYRSKKQRPCDSCRSRKTQCKILDGDLACELCKRLNRSCTFVLQPLRKERPTCVQGGAPKPQQHRLDNGQGAQMSSPDLDNSITTTQIPSTWQNGVHTYDLGSPSNILAIEWSSMDFSLGGFDQNQPPSTNRVTESGLEGQIVRQVEQHNGGNGAYTLESVPPIDDISPSYTNSSMERMNGDPNPDVSGDEHDLDRFIQGLWDRRESNHAFDWPHEFSIDSRRGYSNQVIGLSGESDPFLLRYHRYNINDTYPMFRLDFRNIMGDEKLQPPAENSTLGGLPLPVGYIPIQFVMTDENICQDDLETAEAMFSGCKTELEDLGLLKSLVPVDLGARLLNLYVRFVHPRFPVLSVNDFKNLEDYCCVGLPIGIQAAVFALAAPFIFLDDELSVSKGYLQLSTTELWSIAHRSYLRCTRTSHLSSLQLCLLLLQMPPRNFAVAEPPSTWALSCSALSLAESLGVNLDPSAWRLPANEMRLRKRLWWLTYVQHTWHALLLGRPSHLNDDNWAVSELTKDDFDLNEQLDEETNEYVNLQIPILIALCSLSTIAAEVLSRLFTLKAARGSPSLDAILARAQSLRARIETWRQTLPVLSAKLSTLDDDDLEQCAALRLSHLTLEILIYRALLRHLSYQTISPDEGTRELVSTIFENTYICSKLGTEIISSLKPRHFANFWPQYARYQLCYISSLILLSFAQSPTTGIAHQNKALLGKWRNTLRAQARAWPLARLATMRLDAVFWKGLSAVIHGTGPDSPAMSLLKEQDLRVSGDRVSQ